MRFCLPVKLILDDDKISSTLILLAALLEARLLLPLLLFLLRVLSAGLAGNTVRLVMPMLLE